MMVEKLSDKAESPVHFNKVYGTPLKFMKLIEYVLVNQSHCARGGVQKLENTDKLGDLVKMISCNLQLFQICEFDLISGKEISLSE